MGASASRVERRKKILHYFIDDKTRLTTLYLLRTKDEAPRVYKLFEAWVVNQMGAKIKALNSDRIRGRHLSTTLNRKGLLKS